MAHDKETLIRDVRVDIELLHKAIAFWDAQVVADMESLEMRRHWLKQAETRLAELEKGEQS